ncbi:hypothetical protein J7M28_04615, partial [bacterium]|nr:hypothetical protein [bacterium]
ARNSYIFFYSNILDRAMLRQHLLWSLYFFAKDALKTDFRFHRAFLMALSRTFQILKRRASERRARLIGDREVIKTIQSGDALLFLAD